MPNEPLFDPTVVLNAAADAAEGVTLHFPGSNPIEDRRKFQMLLSATARAAQKRLALSVRVMDDLLATTGWENIRTKSLGKDKLLVYIPTRGSYGIGRINGLNGDTG